MRKRGREISQQLFHHGKEILLFTEPKRGKCSEGRMPLLLSSECNGPFHVPTHRWLCSCKPLLPPVLLTEGDACVFMERKIRITSTQAVFLCMQCLPLWRFCQKFLVISDAFRLVSDRTCSSTSCMWVQFRPVLKSFVAVDPQLNSPSNFPFFLSFPSLHSHCC